MQESKKILISILLEAQEILQVFQIVFQNISINPKNIIKDEIYAVEVANYLVKRDNISFREAHELVSEIILEGTAFRELLIKRKLLSETEILSIFNPISTINSKNHTGSPRPQGVKKEMMEILSNLD